MIDFRLAPVRDHTCTFIRLPAEDERRIAALPATAARINMALIFCAQIGSADKADQQAIRKCEGYMRATLAELVSVEDTLAWERPGKVFRLWQSANPLLHIMRELRNMNVHLQPSTFGTREISVQLRVEGSVPTDIEIFTLQNFTAERFKQLHNAKRYTEQQVEDLVAWFNTFHKQWGIADAIHQGICVLAVTLIDEYGL